MRDVTWEDLEGENAFAVLGTIKRLLTQLERAIPALNGLAKRYYDEATTGDYEHLMDVSHRYAREHLQDTLRVPEERDAAEVWE